MSTNQPKSDLTAVAATVIPSMPSTISNNISSSSSSNTEQPQTKRQKIEKIKTSAGGVAAVRKPAEIVDSVEPATLDTNSNTQHHSSTHSISTPSSFNSSPICTPSTSRASSLAQLVNVQNLVNIVPASSAAATATTPTASAPKKNGTSSFCSSSPSSSSGHSSADEVDRAELRDLLSLGVATRKAKLSVPVVPTVDESSATQDMRDFEQSLMQQCLCGVSELTLRKPFQSHYSMDVNGQKRIANLSEWPTNKLLQFLSNLQLLFDIYLKQNSKGFICSRIMDVCDALIRNDHNLIDEIIVLAGYSNAYVQFLAGRVLASFLVIAKQELDDDWLKKLVDNLFNFDRLDHRAVQKIHFSLEIIKRIVEWKDIDVHPLDTETADTYENPLTPETVSTVASSGEDVRRGLEPHTYMHFQAQQPTLETNYFAVHFRSLDGVVVNNENEDSVANGAHGKVVSDQRRFESSADMSSISGTLSSHNTEIQENFLTNDSRLSLSHRPSSEAFNRVHCDGISPFRDTSTSMLPGCQIVTLTDSESFDTTHLKCITIKILENKWPALVKNMSSLIVNHLNIENAEICILNFLQLWENIISVKANLSIVETLPFYAQLDNFEGLLNQNLSCTIYKQMLCLFNEALCYGSTLALQDMLPDETCSLAHQIVQHVRDSRILDSLPRRQPENMVSLIGFKGKPVIYVQGSLESHYAEHTSSPLGGGDVIEMDKTILQKMVLLVLKSIAVTVKEIRSDSSDSSIDSTDYDACQDMIIIERSIRDVLSKLETFIKNTLEFHPECHFSKILIHLFDDQDDHLIEAMVCTLDVAAGISFRNNAVPEIVSLLNPVYTFLEFLKMISNSSDLLLDLLVSNETCFLLYLLRFLKYIRSNWPMFVQNCYDFGMGTTTLDGAMGVLIRLRLQISRLVSRQLYPYDISPVLRLLESCESLYEGNELS